METEICLDCGQVMKKIAELAGEVQMVDEEMKVVGVRRPVIYQCPEDKTIAVN